MNNGPDVASMRAYIE
jgi:hypothetical protein